MLVIFITPTYRLAVFSLLCTLIAPFAQAQINTVDRPYRAPVPNGAPDLGIAPYTPSTGTVAPVQAMTPPPAPAASVQKWDVFVEDQKLSRALARWTQQEGIQFFWEAPKDLVSVRATYYGSFANAVSDLMLDTPSSGYPLHACRYNNAIRILHTSQSCPTK